MTFLHQFGSLGRGEGGAWGGVGSMGEGNVGDGQEAWQSYTDGPIGLRTYFIFSKYLSLSLKKLTQYPFSLVTLDCDMSSSDHF